MADAGGQPIVPTTIEGLLIQLQRRLNEVENRERGTGRRGWSEALVQVPGWTEVDHGIASWRMLNDGRVELRGRISIPAGQVVGSGDPLLYLSGRCAPPGDGTTHKSWLSTLAPCSTLGTNPGMYRVDVERKIVFDTLTQESLIYAVIIARPPGGVTLTDWIGFDHVIYDPNLYIDTLSPVKEAVHNRVYGKGYPRESDGAHVVQYIPGEFGIAILGYENGSKVSIVPGVDAPASLPPAGPTGP